MQSSSIYCSQSMDRFPAVLHVQFPVFPFIWTYRILHVAIYILGTIQSGSSWPLFLTSEFSLNSHTSGCVQQNSFPNYNNSSERVILLCHSVNVFICLSNFIPCPTNYHLFQYSEYMYIIALGFWATTLNLAAELTDCSWEYEYAIVCSIHNEIANKLEEFITCILTASLYVTEWNW